jgi:beta-mannosidase
MKRESAPLSVAINRSTPELKKLKSPPPQPLGPPHDLASKKYVLDVWAVNGTMQEVNVQIDVRLYDIATGVLREEKRLGGQALAHNRTTELLEDVAVDANTAVQAVMTDARDGHVIARGSDWPQPLKHVIMAESPNLTVRVFDGRVEIQATTPVKGVEVYLADDEREVSWEDNGVDVFPGDVYTIHAAGLTKDDKVEAQYYGLAW